LGKGEGEKNDVLPTIDRSFVGGGIEIGGRGERTESKKRERCLGRNLASITIGEKKGYIRIYRRFGKKKERVPFLEKRNHASGSTENLDRDKPPRDREKGTGQHEPPRIKEDRRGREEPREGEGRGR